MSIYDKKIRTVELSKKEYDKIIVNTEATIKAQEAATKFLKDHKDINLGLFIEHIKARMLPTTRCCTMLGISPRAFLRLRKKYNIEPVYTARKAQKSNLIGNFSPKLSKYATRNYYTEQQLALIPASEILLVQKRFAITFGKKKPMRWTKRGVNANGKLKPRIDNIQKMHMQVSYDSNIDKYCLRKGSSDEWLSKAEVDAFNIRCGKLLAFS